MPRARRRQDTGVFHHVMGRGCRGMPIFSTVVDREHFAYLLTDVTERFAWTIANWVLMPNHHHLLLRLEEPNLDAGMHRLHGLYSQRWNLRHSSTGHVLFRRYKNIVLERSGAAGRVSRYLDLNPVRGGLCARPDAWEWGGYNAIIGRSEPFAFHDARAGARVGVDFPASLEADRLMYARAVAVRQEAIRGRGRPTDARPTLDEIIIRGDIDSIREARETWWYSLRDIARHVGCGLATMHRWLDYGPASGRGAAFERWAHPE